MAEYTLFDQEVTVKINESASEIHSLKDNHNGLEYMWQGDPKYWTGRNPTLFPMVGSTYDKKLHINGKEYAIGNHGFTRHSEFTCTEHDDSHLIMELKDNEETRKQYPFSFTMHIVYTLHQNELQIHYEITNDNDVPMPFNFGLHPAFNCPIDPAGSFADCHLEFNAPEDVKLSKGNLKQTKTLALDRDQLKKTIIITDPQSTSTSLCDGSHRVTVKYSGYEWLAFWSPEAPFVCIEPWHSHADMSEVKVPFEQREGTIILAAHKTWTSEYSITVK